MGISHVDDAGLEHMAGAHQDMPAEGVVHHRIGRRIVQAVELLIGEAGEGGAGDAADLPVGHAPVPAGGIGGFQGIVPHGQDLLRRVEQGGLRPAVGVLHEQDAFVIQGVALPHRCQRPGGVVPVEAGQRVFDHQSLSFAGNGAAKAAPFR